MAAVDYFNRDPVVHTWTYKLDKPLMIQASKSLVWGTSSMASAPANLYGTCRRGHNWFDVFLAPVGPGESESPVRNDRRGALVAICKRTSALVAEARRENVESLALHLEAPSQP
jgi:hypothetical protein